MTRSERRKLAKAARALAGEYAEGRGPALNPADWCGCAAGQIFKRAGIRNPAGYDGAQLDVGLDHILTGATARHVGVIRGEEWPGAVVFPLLYVADLLEAQDG